MNYSKPIICALLVSCLSAPAIAAPGGSWGKTDSMSTVERKIDAKDYQAAIDELTVIVKKESNNADAYNLLGFSNRKLKRYEIAEEYYLQALKLDPKHKGAMEYLGELYVETDRMDEAHRMLARLDKACFLSCSEKKQLKTAIERKEQGLTAKTNW
ncbi:tetratricopeptide repeat protein [Ketobacter sp. MCCC 1A13808]|uniref:tetratricopeptide repeat protein n=1 Tax=Ketobacter sp. MCCC 1A13808 TaxID=2602738 RepID=UPI000F26B269|nr:tetratricopeptide repeat protein [Ketobacter sp. MCCC 1A13808]MVF11502.1 tetratricopeptide repeat protein [Ketobacter sp. MCCC 1A13808]RLP53291.1 MAG: tetratricopeptide repeat protein [Ketobacter sp.]